MIVIGLVLLGLMFVGMFFFKPAKPQSGEVAPRRATHKQEDPIKTHQQTPPQPQRSAQRVGPRIIRGAAEAEEAREEHRKKMQQDAKILLAEFIADTSIATLTRGLYEARNDTLIQTGSYYLQQGDRLKAFEAFEEAANDPNSSLTVRFFAIRQCHFLAKSLGNIEDYFKWGATLGELLRDNDLTHFDQKHNSDFLDKIKQKKIYYQARTNLVMQEAIAQYLIKNHKGYDNNLAMEEVLRRIRQVEEELQL